MMSEGVSAAEPRLHRLAPWFDTEAAAVVTILFGLFQLMLSVLLAYANTTLPKLFILPIVLGLLIVAGGSLTMANERNPSRLLLQGCAYSNVVGLLGAVLAFCLYCYNLSRVTKTPCVIALDTERYSWRVGHSFECPTEALTAYSWSITLLLLLYDIGAVVLHSVLSFCALKTLKTD